MDQEYKDKKCNDTVLEDNINKFLYNSDIWENVLTMQLNTLIKLIA